MDELAGEYSGKIDFYKIDVDKQEELAAAFGVQSIPTLLFIPKNGQPKMMQGALPKKRVGEHHQQGFARQITTHIERDRRGEALLSAYNANIKLFRFVGVWSYQSPPLDHHDVGFADVSIDIDQIPTFFVY